MLEDKVRKEIEEFKKDCEELKVQFKEQDKKTEGQRW